MKSIKFYAATVTVFALALLLANAPVVAQQLRGNGNLKTVSRDVSGFKGIDVSGGFNVEITQGLKEGVRLEAEENLLDNIKTEVKNGVLHIYNDKSLNSTKSMKAYITVKELNKIAISGGVKVTGNGTFKSDRFDLNMSGGSAVTLAVDANQLVADMSGASKVELTGRADVLNMDMSGASKVEAADLVAKRVKIEASGASKVKVYAKEALDINASGASVVYYKGSPSISSDVSAAAKISKM
ncbi:head GIN domain-containing protein [Pontibacter liquoris]|uniref:head GIN domain-containing protein n=1 Tax=Pontibacter liquoris TaxID=2905677 RepID=UPI001FA77D7C|nr:head GIN domain-containing protein [Pontibacter liquoris]